MSKQPNVFAPLSLRCEYLTNPLGIENLNPKFSWALKHTEPNQYQTAYQIIVSDDCGLIQREQGNIWDSGKIESNQSINVVYGGKTLEFCKKYYWRVRWWDKEGNASQYSDIATFEMGLGEGNWKAKWISGKNIGCYETKGDNLHPNDVYKFYYAIMARKGFNVSKAIKSARIYVSGVGYYELHINGQRIGDKVLDPGQTDYRKKVFYSVYDITDKISEGPNAVAVMVGNGRFIKDYGYDFPRLIAQINIYYNDGSSDTIISDESWKTSDGPIRENGIYLGETYDARLEKVGWDMPGYDETEWEDAICVDGPGGKLVSEVMPPIKVDKIMRPVSISNPQPGVYVYDFGQNFTGWVRLRVEGKRGDTVKLKFAELLNEKGMLHTKANIMATATDTYILKGDGVEVYEPHFTYHGFRYVEVTGYPGIPSLESIEGRFVHTAVEHTGSFVCSNNLLNNIHKNVLYGQLSNLMSIPTDCPQRSERMGWMGDAHLTAEEAIYNFDMAAFYAKYLDDIKVSQKEDGSLSDVMPPYWALYPADPAWGTAYITIAFEMYRYFNDVQILKEHYDGMRKWVDFLSSKAEDGLVNYVKYGEWCSPGSIPPKHTPRELTSAFYYYHDVLVLSEIAKIIGKKAECEELKGKAKEIRDAFNKKYFNQEHSFYGNNDQTSDTLGLQFGMSPEGKRKAVFDNLLENVINNADYHFDTGIIGTKYILDTLCDFGQKDVAFKMMTQESYPSFGYMIKEGATTIWERWEKLTSGGMNSHNHIMFGTVDAWFYKYLAGIKVSKPGWEEITIMPVIPEGLTHAGASVKTFKGYIKSYWAKKDGYNAFEVEIPVNTTAKVMIPTLGYDNIEVLTDGKAVEGINISRVMEANEDYFSMELGSGSYSIKVS